MCVTVPGATSYWTRKGRGSHSLPPTRRSWWRRSLSPWPATGWEPSAWPTKTSWKVSGGTDVAAFPGWTLRRAYPVDAVVQWSALFLLPGSSCPEPAFLFLSTTLPPSVLLSLPWKPFSFQKPFVQSHCPDVRLCVRVCMRACVLHALNLENLFI